MLTIIKQFLDTILFHILKSDQALWKKRKLIPKNNTSESHEWIIEINVRT